jgi:acetyl esterase/lipase
VQLLGKGRGFVNWVAPVGVTVRNGGMSKIVLTVGVLLIVLGLAYHFAALQIFGLLVPKDEGSRLYAGDVSYGADQRQTLDVYGPTEGEGPFPVVVFVHGGSWETGSKNPYAFVGRAFAAQGFVTMVINYRLHPAHKYPAFVEDTALALTWAAANAAAYRGDRAKLFAIGQSAGGYNVAQAVLNQSFQTPKLAGVATLAAPLDFLPLDSPITIKVFGGVADLPETQPVNHVRADAPPFLILHGTADPLVYPKNARSLDAALRGVGAASELIIYEGINHRDTVLALSRVRRDVAPMLADIVRFLKDKSR